MGRRGRRADVRLENGPSAQAGAPPRRRPGRAPAASAPTLSPSAHRLSADPGGENQPPLLPQQPASTPFLPSSDKVPTLVAGLTLIWMLLHRPRRGCEKGRLGRGGGAEGAAAAAQAVARPPQHAMPCPQQPSLAVSHLNPAFPDGASAPLIPRKCPACDVSGGSCVCLKPCGRPGAFLPNYIL